MKLSWDKTAPPVIRLAIFSAVRLVRESLAELLSERPSLLVLEGFGSVADIPKLAELCPDVVLIDLGHAEAAQVARRVKAVCPSAKPVAFALAEVDEDVFACAAAGFSSYVPRESGADELYRALIDAASGRMQCAPHIAQALFSRLSGLLQDQPAPALLSALTARENEILALAGDGCSNKDIARRLDISPATVKNHVHNILQKLQVSRRGEAAARLRRLSVV